MVKSELVKQVAHELEITQKKSATIINLIFGKIRNQVLANELVKISGFGVFFPKNRMGNRQTYVPKRKEYIMIGSRRSLAFKPAANNSHLKC